MCKAVEGLVIVVLAVVVVTGVVAVVVVFAVVVVVVVVVGGGAVIGIGTVGATNSSLRVIGRVKPMIFGDRMVIRCSTLKAALGDDSSLMFLQTLYAK